MPQTGQGKNSVEFALHGQVFSRYIRSGPRTADTQTETQTLDCREKFGRHSMKGRKQAQGMGYGVLTLNRGISGMCEQSKTHQQKEDAQLRRMGDIIKSASSWLLLEIPSLLGCMQSGPCRQPRRGARVPAKQRVDYQKAGEKCTQTATLLLGAGLTGEDFSFIFLFV